MTRADRNNQVTSANSHCDVDCLNDGYCSFTKYTDYPLKGDIGYYQSCTCRPGFGGGGCEKVVEECLPPHYKCNSGAPCEKDENGSLYCDCSFADAKSELAGFMCQEPTIQACDTLDENNKSFCTNGGNCLSSTTASSKHLMFSEPTVHEGCQCVDGFSGDHCEFLLDMPKSSLIKTSSGKSTGAKVGITLSVGLAVIAILGAMLVHVRRKRRHLRARTEQSLNNGMKFRRFFLERLARDSMVSGYDDQDTGNEVDMEFEEGLGRIS